VRLVCFGDIHIAFQAIERLGPSLHEADWAILTGDLTHFGDAWGGMSSSMVSRARKRLAREAGR